MAVSLRLLGLHNGGASRQRNGCDKGGKQREQGETAHNGIVTDFTI
ncbi:MULTISPECIES: hypothetical protein [unclassified Pseudoxanthomonas]